MKLLQLICMIYKKRQFLMITSFYDSEEEMIKNIKKADMW